MLSSAPNPSVQRGKFFGAIRTRILMAQSAKRMDAGGTKAVKRPKGRLVLILVSSVGPKDHWCSAEG